MIIKIKKSTYKGFSDGTSLTNERCKQILAIYQHVQSLGKKLMNYKELQKEVAKEKLFGGQTIGESAIRTIFPLLAKTGLIMNLVVKKLDSFMLVIYSQKQGWLLRKLILHCCSMKIYPTKIYKTNSNIVYH